ncbi:hypothetical protein BZG36_01886 [Bifiguratus adelaidae]|uniref:Biogenesis of lysosome-related organelles complex 1 subunit 1 n=1 Tax=Bifiguratus adelaidae TaxID=1938954 RepID=A0A261Y4G0_9FUNG|nr:hypothetical protein BZG36_01886 [Bifiguratus adelaidae]
MERLLKEHRKEQDERRQRNDALRRQAVNATKEAGQALTAKLEGEQTRQRDIEQQAKQLKAQTTRYSKQTKQWLTLVDNFNVALKELGDVQQWASVMERDLTQVMGTLEEVHRGPPNTTSL